MGIKIENVNLDVADLKSVISKLDDAIARNQKLRSLCEQILAIQGAQPKASKGRRSGSRAQSAQPAARAPRVSQRKRPKLRDVITQVLSKRSKPVAPADLRDLVKKAGYPTKSGPKNFYITVYNTAKNTPGVVKTDDGFIVQEGASKAKPGPKPGKKTRKKTGSRGTKKRVARKKTRKKRTKSKR